jgi:DNA-binding protein Fis
MKRGRKKHNIQTKARRKHFDFHQYWNISYTERYSDGTEKDFKTFIRAKSYALAKDVLKRRIKEDDPSIKLKAIQGFMFHNNYKSDTGKTLGIEEWEQIKNSAFPNSSNTVFKFHVPRPDWKSNRFNATNHEHLKTIGFKKGDENWSTIHRKGKSLPYELREGKIWVGHEWREWDKHEMEDTKKRIISALILHGNNRTAAAKDLGINRNSLYKLMRRITGVDWNKEYPIVRLAPPIIPTEQRSAIQKKVMAKKMESGYIPFSHLTEEQEAKKRLSIKETFRKKREKKLNEFIPLAKKALSECENSRSKAADMMGIKRSYFSKMMRQTKHIVNWSKDFPNNYLNNR